jgi:hypothetical protein
MKKLCIIILSFLVVSAMAQTQIPEGGFNNWTPSSTNTYSEPTGGWWTTLNALESLGGPITVSPTTDVHSGAYAAQLETKMWGTFLLSGLLASGNFEMTAPFIEQGRPFTDKPSKFKGWYKYAPVSGDSAAIVARLTRFNEDTDQQDTIAEAIQVVKNIVSTYTQFEINFDYSITGINPDTITIVFMSSAEAGNFQGQVGSTLLIDDILLEYPTGLQESLAPELTVNVFPLPAAEQLSFEFNTLHPEKLLCYIYAIDGRFIQSFSLSAKKHQLDVSNWQQGRYILQAYMGNSLVSSAKFIVAH